MHTEAVEVQVALEAPQALVVPADAAIQAWVDAVLAKVGRSGALCVRIVEASESQALNLKYRGRDRPTNVLSFTAEIPPGIESSPRLGDIAVCAAIVEAEAQQQQKVALNHWAHMIIHGVLHLLGYDHQNHRQADEMETLEVKILEHLGIANPYDY